MVDKNGVKLMVTPKMLRYIETSFTNAFYCKVMRFWYIYSTTAAVWYNALYSWLETQIFYYWLINLLVPCIIYHMITLKKKKKRFHELGVLQLYRVWLWKCVYLKHLYYRKFILWLKLKKKKTHTHLNKTEGVIII